MDRPIHAEGSTICLLESWRARIKTARQTVTLASQQLAEIDILEQVLHKLWNSNASLREKLKACGFAWCFRCGEYERVSYNEHWKGDKYSAFPGKLFDVRNKLKCCGWPTFDAGKIHPTYDEAVSYGPAELVEMGYSATDRNAATNFNYVVFPMKGIETDISEESGKAKERGK